MIKQNSLPTKGCCEWPENYYRETDAANRKEILMARIEEGRINGEKVSRENQLRLLLWEKRYLNGKGKQDGIDYYLKMWNELKFALEQKSGLFGKKTLQKTVKSVKDVFQLDRLKKETDCRKVWYDEYVNFCSFYIGICQTDKSYTSVLFHLATISEENLTIKIARDLYEKTVVIPKKLGMAEDFSMLAKAARDSFLFYYPNEEELYDRLEKAFLTDECFS